MCGIIGYVGNRQAQPILLNGLRRLEYRGYDSAGVCIFLNNKKALSVRKLPGKVRALENLIAKKPLDGSLGIGHCLAPDTYVFLCDGKIKKIAELENKTGVISVDLEKLVCRNSNRITVFRHESPPFIYQIKTPYFTFAATGQHRILAATSSGEIVERRIEELNDELIAMPRHILLEYNAKSLRLKDVFVERHFVVTSLGRAKLRKARRARGYLLKEVEKLTGVKAQYIHRIESGQRISIEKDRLERLSQCYKINFSKSYFRVENYITNDLFLPKVTNDKLMQILGYFTGDGHISERMIRFKERDLQICRIYQGLSKEVFNIDSNLKNKRGHYVFVISSRFLGNWVRENFATLVSPMLEKDLPEFIGSLPKGQISKFLRGLFDAEGAVGMQAGQISLGMVSRQVIQKTQLLLLRFGVLATYSEQQRSRENWNNVYRLSINDKDSLESFEKEIGFSSVQKQKKLRSVINSKKYFNYKYFSLPIRLDKLYRDYLKPTGIKGWHRIGVKPKKSYLTDYRLERILKWVQKEKRFIKERRKIEEFAGQVEKFTESSLVWVRPVVVKIDSPYNFVYDLEVNPSSNFIGNGILQHNSRWATHGAPNQINAHPHLDCKGEVAIVHNGIIENYAKLKGELIKEGHKFLSQTDTEVVVHLIEKFYKDVPLEEAVRKSLKFLVGSFAIGVISRREPGKLVGARLGSPLIIGVGNNENFLASDVPAILEHTRDIVYLQEGEIAVLDKKSFYVTDLSGKPVIKKPTRISWDIAQAQKQGYPHFMLKEINEQPRIVENLLNARIQKDARGIRFEEQMITDDKLKQIKSIAIVACGTAYHAGIVGKYILESICGVPVSIDVSSEFRYRDLLIDSATLVIAVSQSGETADTLAGVREARLRGGAVLSICNVLGSTLTRESDGVIYTHAGPEIGVASTKAYTAQLVAFYLFAFYLAKIRNTLSPEKIAKLLRGLRGVPKLQSKILKNQRKIANLARRHSHFGSFLFLGRNINFPSALEGALKLKEISYIPAEGYAAGEMKHGPIALIDEYRAVVCISPASKVYEKMISNIQEIHSRRGKIIVIATEGDGNIKELTREVIYIPKIDEFFSPLVVALPLQLLAYHIAVKRGCDVDQPRNLAKSVTVE